MRVTLRSENRLFKQAVEGEGFEDIWKHTKVVLDDLHHCVSSVEDLLANPTLFMFAAIALVMIDCCCFVFYDKTDRRERCQMSRSV